MGERAGGRATATGFATFALGGGGGGRVGWKEVEVEGESDENKWSLTPESLRLARDCLPNASWNGRSDEADGLREEETTSFEGVACDTYDILRVLAKAGGRTASTPEDEQMDARESWAPHAWSHAPACRRARDGCFSIEGRGREVVGEIEPLSEGGPSEVERKVAIRSYLERGGGGDSWWMDDML